MQDLKNKVEQTLDNNLPEQVYRSVVVRKTFYGSYYLQIIIAAADYHINGVQGQRPQMVSFALEDDLSFEAQHYGGCGGRSIELKPEKGSYLAIKRIKIPFRKPKKAEKNVLKALERFCERYVQALRENVGELKYEDVVDYNSILF